MLKTLSILYAIFLIPSLASFLAVYVERGKAGKSLMGRSYCICGTLIPWYYNVPIVSYIFLTGKAKCCGSRIPFWYFAYELVALLVALPLTYLFSIYGLLLSIMLLISIAIKERHAI